MAIITPTYTDPTPAIPAHFPSALRESVLTSDDRQRPLDMFDLSRAFKGTDYVPVICGTGWSWNDLPPDFDFGAGKSKAILFLMNGAAMAPQFWDHEQNKYKQPWHFWLALDKDVSNPKFFPENKYYPIAMEHPSGFKIVTSPFIWNTIAQQKENPIYKYKRVIRLDTTGPKAKSEAELYSEYPGYVIMGYGAVLHMALQVINVMWGIDEEHKQSPKTEIILLGCDHCCYPPHRRRWWDEMEELKDKRPAYNVKQNEDNAIWDIEKRLDPNQKLELPFAGQKQFGGMVKPGITIREFNKQLPAMNFRTGLTPYPSPTNNQQVLVNTMYVRQRKYVMKYIDAMTENGVKFWKFAERKQGFLDIPSITSVEDLESKIGM